MSTGLSDTKVTNDLFVRSHRGRVMKAEASMLEWAEEKLGGEEVEGHL